MTLMINPLHTWNVIYNARSNKSQPPTSASTAPATKNDSRDQSSSHMKRYLQCAEQHVSLSKLTKYCACHEKWISWLILVTHETLFTMRGATRAIVQTHQILRLPRKINLMIDPCHTWNVIYNARSNKCHCPNSPNTAPATKNESHDWSLSHMKRYLQCAEQQASLSKLTKYCACHAKWFSKISETFLQNRWNVNYNARPIRDHSENDPRMKPSLRNPPRNRGYFSRPPQAFCIEKYNISRSGYHSKFHQILRLPRKVTLQLHQILRLPRKMTLMINPRHTWNAIYNARNNRWHPPTSPNTAPATQNDSPTFQRNFSKTAETSFPMRGRSENDPRMIRAGNRPPQPASQPRLLFTPTTSILYWKIQHFALRLSFQISPNTAPATKSDSSTSPNTAPATQSDSSTSPNTAPATQSNCHDWSSSHMKCHLQCAEQPVSSSNITKYCACHAKWLSNISKKFLENSWNVISNAGPIRAGSEQDPSRKPSSATRLATEVTFQDHHEHFVLKNTTFRAPAIIPNFTEYCACHEKWHFNFTEYCACHEKWHLNVAK